MYELIKASSYYHNKAPGWVVLINGNPYHFIGKQGKKEATLFINNNCR